MSKPIPFSPPDITEEEIKEYMAGNLCRCTGYVSHMRVLKQYLTEKGKGMRL